MKYRITHTTAYAYSDPVSLCHNEVRLTPRDRPNQRCLRSELAVEPAPGLASRRTDWFGNVVTHFTVQRRHERLAVTATSDVEVIAAARPDPAASPPWEEVRDALPQALTREGLDAYQFVFESRYVPLGSDLGAYASGSFTPGRPLLEAALDLSRRIFADFRYDQAATTLATPIAEVLERRRGVCQDFAHVAIGCLRSLGLAARYVSGYVATRPPPGEPRLAGAEASHAWMSVYMPGPGWVDIDPTNDRIPSDEHVTLAWGRDYGDVSPIKGVLLGGGRHTMTVSVHLAPIPEPPGD